MRKRSTSINEGLRRIYNFLFKFVSLNKKVLFMCNRCGSYKKYCEVIFIVRKCENKYISIVFFVMQKVLNEQLARTKNYSIERGKKERSDNSER